MLAAVNATRGEVEVIVGTWRFQRTTEAQRAQREHREVKRRSGERRMMQNGEELDGRTDGPHLLLNLYASSVRPSVLSVPLWFSGSPDVTEAACAGS
jgi:hypothetical protein